MISSLQSTHTVNKKNINCASYCVTDFLTDEEIVKKRDILCNIAHSISKLRKELKRKKEPFKKLSVEKNWKKFIQHMNELKKIHLCPDIHKFSVSKSWIEWLMCENLTILKKFDFDNYLTITRSIEKQFNMLSHFMREQNKKQKIYFEGKFDWLIVPPIRYSYNGDPSDRALCVLESNEPKYNNRNFFPEYITNDYHYTDTFKLTAYECKKYNLSYGSSCHLYEKI